MTTTRTAWAGGTSPVHVVLAILAAFLLRLGIGPIKDLDLPWHVLLGREILSQHTLSGLGTGWLGVPSGHWVSSEWLAEVGYAVLVEHGGWRAVLVLRLVLLVLTLAALAVTLLRLGAVLLAAPIVALAAIAVTSLSVDRPQTISFLFVILLGHLAVRLWDTGRRPPLLLLAGGSLLWAQLHGLWIIAPAAFVVSGIGPALRSWRHPLTPPVRRAALSAAACLAGVVNPHGFGSFALPFTFRAATPGIAEWRPTTLAQPYSAAWALVLLLTVAAWVRRRGGVPAAEIVWVATWWAFGAMAYRNVVPSLLLIAPASVLALERTWGSRAAGLTRASTQAERRFLAATATLVLAAGGVVAGWTIARTDPLSDIPARAISARLADRPAPVRVFNTYNTSGSLAAFGGGKVRLVIDARADLWGAAYIQRITDAQELRPGWRRTFAESRPDAAVLPRSAPLVQWLVQEGTWRIDLVDGTYVLLLPTSPASP